jgi:dTDP-4-amino-4,6-dideoxygalactose transaminase
MKVPFLDLGRLHASIRGELDEVIATTIDSSGFINGPAVSAFEAEFAVAHDADHAIGCGSGTVALELALRALGLGRGDEVIVPSMTFFATAEAVANVGATPVVADVEAATLLLGPAQVDAVRTDRTRAVLPVHLYGHVVPFEYMEAWAASGLLVVEDAAQAHLATWRGRPVGASSRAACFSFFPGKNLGALGDAGAVLTQDPDLAHRIMQLRDHGRLEKYVHAEFGMAARLDALQARVLQVKLRHLATWTARRRAVAARYRELLADAESVRLVPWDDGAVHHLLVVRLHDRDRMAAALADEGVGTGVHYPVPLSRQPPLAGRTRPCPVSERAADEILSLPMDPLMSDAEVDFVCERVLDLARTR